MNALFLLLAIPGQPKLERQRGYTNLREYFKTQTNLTYGKQISSMGSTYDPYKICRSPCYYSLHYLDKLYTK